jgi:hypothetical protein
MTAGSAITTSGVPSAGRDPDRSTPAGRSPDERVDEMLDPHDGDRLMDLASLHRSMGALTVDSVVSRFGTVLMRTSARISVRMGSRVV